MKLSAHGITHTGRQRPENEDAFIADVERRLFAVADGLGGLPDGALASRLAVDVLLQSFCGPHLPDDLAGLAKVMRTAHAHVLTEGRSRHPESGIGTTLTVATVVEGVLLVGHTGDSGAFLCRSGRPVQALTTEHNLATLYRGDMPDAEAQMPAYFQHTLTQCLGMSEPFHPDFTAHTLQPGDRILLCTDGVTKVLPPSRLAALLLHARTPASATRRIQKSVLAAGAPDNLTAVAIFVH